MLVPARAGIAGRRIRAERREEGGRRRRPRREAADPDDGLRAPAARRIRHRRFRRRARHRHLPRASSRGGGAADSQARRLDLVSGLFYSYLRGKKVRLSMRVTSKGQVTIPKHIRQRHRHRCPARASSSARRTARYVLAEGRASIAAGQKGRGASRPISSKFRGTLDIGMTHRRDHGADCAANERHSRRLAMS